MTSVEKGSDISKKPFNNLILLTISQNLLKVDLIVKHKLCDIKMSGGKQS